MFCFLGYSYNVKLWFVDYYIDFFECSSRIVVVVSVIVF